MKSNLLGGVLGAAALACLSFPTAGFAGLVTGTTSGVFTNPSPTKGQNSSMVYSYSDATAPHFTGSNQYPDLSPAVNNATSGTNFRWGNPSTFGTGPNQLWWNKNSPIAAQTEAEFKLGTISYFNGTTTTTSVPNSIQLKINLDLSTLDGSAISVTQDFAFTLELITTPNDTGSPQGDADYVKFPTSWPSTIFTVGGVDYTLKLIGFQNATSGGFVGSNNPNEFHVMEGFTASADLMGIITSDVSGVVPEPASVVSAAVAGLSGLAFAARRRRRNATV